VSCIVATAVVVVGGGPAPAQLEEPLGPDVVFVEAYGPAVLGYEDCEGVLHTEEVVDGYVFVELDDQVALDTTVTVSYGGDLADDLAEAPTEIPVAAGEGWGEVPFSLAAFATGELTVTVEPGLGYVADADDTSILAVTDEVFLISRCDDDLTEWLDDPDRARQTIDVGEQPRPFGFFDSEEDGADGGGDTATTEAFEGSTAPASPDPMPAITRFRSLQRGVQAVPEPFDTPVVGGSLPPGLTYVDDEWGGAATTPGTYDFAVRLCYDLSALETSGRVRPTPQAFPEVICLGTLDAQVVVEAQAATPPSTAPPASPVQAAARFTG